MYRTFFSKVRLWWRLRRLNIYLNAWALLVGFLAVLQSVQYFIDPDSLKQNSSLGDVLQNWAYVWNVFYFLGGIGILYGIIRPHRMIDVYGLCSFIVALAINALVIIFVRGSGAGAVVPTLVAVALTCALRIWFLVTTGDFFPRGVVETSVGDHPRLDRVRDN